MTYLMTVVFSILDCVYGSGGVSDCIGHVPVPSLSHPLTVLGGILTRRQSSTTTDGQNTHNEGLLLIVPSP